MAQKPTARERVRRTRPAEFKSAIPSAVEQQRRDTVKEESHGDYTGEHIVLGDDQELSELDREFTESRIVPNVEHILARKSTKPTTKVKLLMEHYGYSFEEAKALVVEAAHKYGFRRDSVQSSTGTYSKIAGHAAGTIREEEHDLHTEEPK